MYLLIWIVSIFCRVETRGSEHFESIIKAGKVPIYGSWHNRLVLTTYKFRNRGILSMVSKSKDGEYIAGVIKKFGNHVIRGSSSRGGSRALIELIHKMREGRPAGFALDGPRGPRYVVKPGPLILAKRTGFPILPFLFETKRYWQLKSWDKLQIPKPFTKAVLIFNPPIYVDPTASEADLAALENELQASMDMLVEMGRSWREDQS